MENVMRVISLGWGVQSFTLAAMAALGDIEPVDAAIHADTTHERSATYTFAARWTPWLEARGVRVVTVQPTEAEPVNRFGGLMLPAYTVTQNGNGKFSRQCTDDWKRAPIRRWLQANRKRQPVTMLLGISRDELHRAKDSNVKYITHEWPLLGLNMTRNDCINYLERHGLDVPSRSACVFCPLQSKNDWRQVKNEQALDWFSALAADEAIRKSKPPYDVFLHRSCMPLVDVDLSTPEDHGQLRLLNDECDSGYCFL